MKLESTVGDHTWPGGFTGQISVDITDFYNSWKIIMKFPKPVYRIYVSKTRGVTQYILVYVYVHVPAFWGVFS